MSNRHSTEYWQNRRANGNVKQHTSIVPPVKFVAVDGEGTQEGAEQFYSLLSSSHHNPISKRSGLSTEQCLEYLVSLRTDDRTQIVSYGFSYDSNMILRDLKPWQKMELYEDNECWFKGKEHDYLIHRIKGKSFSVTQYTQQRVYHEGAERIKSVTIWDTFGFFQGSFIKAVDDYKIPMTPEQRQLLEEGKGERGGFLWEQLGKITEYNHLECDLLVLLMEEVQTMLRGLGIYLNRWDGAGAIAAGLMKKYGVKKHVVQGFTPEVEDAFMRSYFGGRSQCVQFGIFEQPVYHYDLNSAYPSSYLDLPTLHGEWFTADRYLPNEKYVLYQLSWDLPKKELLTPFPYRLDDGGISYPRQGRGIYHSLLVDVAMKRWERYIKIEKAFVFHPATDEKPFSWVQEFMTERLRLKKLGDLRHITMKLGANSIYGKTAQSIGFRDKVPPYQNYYWAGRITSYSHAQLLAAGLQYPGNVLFFGTDAIFTDVPLDLPIGNTLGSWEDCGVIDKFELYQPGLYRMHFFADEEVQTKTRGFRSEEIDFDELETIWNKVGYAGLYPAKVIRFQSLEVTEAQNRPMDWCQWKEFTKIVRLMPGGFGHPVLNYRDELCKNYRFDFVLGGDDLSAPFVKKNMLLPEGKSYLLEEYEYLDNLEID